MSKHLLGFKAICVSVALLASAPSFCDNALGNRIAQLESDMNQIRGQTALWPLFDSGFLVVEAL